MITPMNPEVKAKWVAALRSGEYKQTTGCLHNTSDGFCCLGVLTDLYIKEHGGEWTIPGCSTSQDFEGEGEMLPDKVRIWAGLPNCAGATVNSNTEEDPEMEDLTEINDGGENFQFIATIIEEQL